MFSRDNTTVGNGKGCSRCGLHNDELSAGKLAFPGRVHPRMDALPRRNTSVAQEQNSVLRRIVRQNRLTEFWPCAWISVGFFVSRSFSGKFRCAPTISTCRGLSAPSMAFPAYSCQSRFDSLSQPADLRVPRNLSHISRLLARRVSARHPGSGPGTVRAFLRIARRNCTVVDQPGRRREQKNAGRNLNWI